MIRFFVKTPGGCTYEKVGYNGMVKHHTPFRMLRFIGRSVLVVTALFWFVFALLSGAELLGGGIWGIVRNSPNALPWLFMFGIVYATIRYQRIGSIVCILISSKKHYADSTIHCAPVSAF